MRPKILTAITIPSGGWRLKLYLDVGVGDGTPVTATMAAGTYFMAFDGQSDDFLFELATRVNAAIFALGGTWDDNGGTDYLRCLITSDLYNTVSFVGVTHSNHRTMLAFTGPSPGTSEFLGKTIKIAWTELEGASIAKVLGFDHTADDSQAWNSNPAFVGDYQHAYAWYADEDGQGEHMPLVDEPEAKMLQAVSDGGRVSTQLVSERFASRLQLQHVPRLKMLSDGIGYTETSLHPYARNVPLQCWWMQAIQGKRFRVYRDAHLTLAKSPNRGTATSATATTLTDNTRTLVTEPQRFKSRRLISYPDVAGGGALGSEFPYSYFVSSHTSTVYTFSAAVPGSAEVQDATAYRLFDHTYGTYVLDAAKMRRFAPEEVGRLDRFDLDIPLRKYSA